jgi:hypothetical protein
LMKAKAEIFGGVVGDERLDLEAVMNSRVSERWRRRASRSRSQGDRRG